MTRPVARAALLAAAALAAAPAGAHAHGIVTVDGGELVFSGDEATSRDTLRITVEGADLRLRDTTSDGGLDPGPCRPGEVDDGGAIVEALCPSTGITALRVDLGGREDSADLRSLALPADVRGGDGADVVRSGAGADTLDGGSGDDTLSAGAGDDVVLARDGRPDTISCGTGTDTVQADQLDAVCETVERLVVTPDGATGPDAQPPTVTGARPTARTVKLGRGRVAARATAGEDGRLVLTGTLAIGDRTYALRAARATAVAGRSTTLTIRLSSSKRRAAEAALRKRRRVVARLVVVATDAAGNSTQVALPAVRIVR